MATIKETQDAAEPEIKPASLASFRIVESDGHRSIDKTGKVSGSKDFGTEITVTVADSDEARIAAVDLYLKMCNESEATLLRFGPEWFIGENV